MEKTDDIMDLARPEGLAGEGSDWRGWTWT